MNLHIIVDFMHIYYKYFFQNQANKLSKLSAPVEWNGSVVVKDTTLIYYPLRDIEGIRKSLESLGHTITMSICFDSPSKRSEDNTEYKSNRTKRLNDNDFENISIIKRMLEEAGHNIYSYEGYEADDLVNHLVRNYKNDFEYTVIYTNDKDLLINICDKVGAMRFKQTKGYTQVDMSNYEQYLEPEFGTFIPYNMLGLYLCVKGDSSDHVKGIKNYGPKSFGKLLTKLCMTNEIDKARCGDYDYLLEVIKMCQPLLNEEQFKQLNDSYAMVANMEVPDTLEKPTNKSTEDKRHAAYVKYNMLSLVS